MPRIGTVLSLSDPVSPSSSRVHWPWSASSASKFDLKPLRSLDLDTPPEPPMVTCTPDAEWKTLEPVPPVFVPRDERLRTKSWRRAGSDPAMRPMAVSTLDQRGILAMWSVSQVKLVMRSTVGTTIE